jgi:hypothetical protein
MDGEMAVLAEDDEVVGPLLAAPFVSSVVNVEPTASVARLAGVTGAPESAETPLRPTPAFEGSRVRHRPERFLARVPGFLFVV